MSDYTDLMETLYAIVFWGAAFIGIGYAGSLWTLSREQLIELEAFRAIPAQTEIDCAAAERVAICATDNPGQKCEIISEGAK